MSFSDENASAVTNRNPLLNPDGDSPPVSVIDPDNPPWGIGLALTVFVASVVFLVVVPQLCVLPYLVTHYQSVPLDRNVLLADKTFVLIFILAQVPVHLLTFALAWAVATRMGKLSPRKTLGWSWSKNFGLWKSVMLGLALLMFTVFLSFLIARFFGEPDTDMEKIIESSRGAALVTAFLAVATAPLVEETVYRGILYPALLRSTGPVGATVLVAGLFAGLHVLQYWPNATAISAVTLLSIVLTIVRARTGRLLPCFVMHLTFNGVQAGFILIETYRPEIERYILRRNPSGILIGLFHL